MTGRIQHLSLYSPTVLQYSHILYFSTVELQLCIHDWRKPTSVTLRMCYGAERERGERKKASSSSYLSAKGKQGTTKPQKNWAGTKRKTRHIYIRYKYGQKTTTRTGKIEGKSERNKFQAKERKSGKNQAARPTRTRTTTATTATHLLV